MRNFTGSALMRYINILGGYEGSLIPSIVFNCLHLMAAWPCCFPKNHRSTDI